MRLDTIESHTFIPTDYLPEYDFAWNLVQVAALNTFINNEVISIPLFRRGRAHDKQYAWEYSN